jgi:hypothetical protein
LHPTYSPELKIAGAALGGLIPNLSALLELERYSKGERARFGPPVMLGLSHDFANLSMWMNQSLVPENEAEYRKAEHHCFDSNSLYSYQDLGKYYKKGYNSLSEPIPRSVVATAGTMGYRSTPTIPWYLYEALADDASPIDLTDRLYKKHCANGANILVRFTGHPIYRFAPILTLVFSTRGTS